MVEYLGLWVLVALSFNMWALLSVLSAPVGFVAKLVWAVLLLVLPGIAFVVWFLLGPRRSV